MPRNGRRSVRSRRRSAARRRRCAAGCGRRSGTGGCGRCDAAESGPDQGAGAGGPRAASGERDPAQGVGVFCDGGARPPVQAMIAFIDDHREVYGVEPICRVLPIAPSTYHAHAARRADPRRLPPRAKRDAALRARSAGSSSRISGSTGCARSGGSSQREGIDVARCTVGPPDAADGPAGRCPRQGGAEPRSATRRRRARSIG